MKTTLRLSIAAFGLAIFNLSAFVAQAQFDYENNNGTVTITKYTGPGGDVTIPSEINGLPVTSIGNRAFYECTSLTSLTIPDSVTTIESWAFSGCSSLTDFTISDSVTNIGGGAFSYCASLTAINVDPQNPAYSSLDGVLFDKNQTMLMQCPAGKTGSYTIPNTVTSIESFQGCTSVTSIIVPDTVISLGSFYTFNYCASLTGVYFTGNAPYFYWYIFGGATNATIYYLPGTIGWGDSYAGRPTVPWVLRNPVILTLAPNFGIQSNAFGFRISWATNASVVVEASTSIANPIWNPVSTNALVNGWSDFSDAEWTNYPSRFYRTRHW